MANEVSGYEQFAGLIEDRGGVFPTTMEVLRDAHGVGKLGVHIRKAIADELQSRGIGTLPEVLPSYYHEEVRLFRLGTPIADVVSAVLHPSAAGDDTLRRSGGNDAEMINQIRAIVCE